MKGLVLKQLKVVGCAAVVAMALVTPGYSADVAVAPTTTTTVTSSSTALKVGVIDVASILQQSPQMQETMNALKKKFKPRQDKLAQIHKKIVDDEAKLKKDGSVMSKSDTTKLKDQIGENQRELRRLQEDYVEDTRTAQREAMEAIMQKVNAIVQKIAETGNFDLILQRDVVAFASTRLDITSQVLSGLKEDKK